MKHWLLGVPRWHGVAWLPLLCALLSCPSPGVCREVVAGRAASLSFVLVPHMPGQSCGHSQGHPSSSPSPGAASMLWGAAGGGEGCQGTPTLTFSVFITLTVSWDCFGPH